ncbi:hypothetical protein [Paenarthrobacter sp. C1]|uniref:hypothetical protein n=1 Tax=Paenarthrobacter sp. C1 TaxID=3400220 RepID=UPI003BF57E76
MKSTLYSIWLKVQEPRALSVIYFFAYLAIGLLGLFVATDPPRNVQSSLGTGLLTFWGGLLLTGGALGSFSVLPGIWWLERAATLMCMTAIGIYGVTMAAAPITQLSLRMATLCFITFSILAFAARLVKIRQYAYDPEK